MSLIGEPNGASDYSVSFEIVIGNVCVFDKISFTSLIPDVIYTVKSDPTLFSDFPVIVQDEPSCPV